MWRGKGDGLVVTSSSEPSVSRSVGTGWSWDGNVVLKVLSLSSVSPVTCEVTGLTGDDGRRESLLCVWTRVVTEQGQDCGGRRTGTRVSGSPRGYGGLGKTETVTLIVGIPLFIGPWTIMGRCRLLTHGVTSQRRERRVYTLTPV